MHLHFRLFLSVCIFALSLQGHAQMSRPGVDSGVATPIDASIFVTDIDDIDSANQSFVANVYMEFRWFDPRLVKNNGATEVTSFDKIWQPRIQVVNQQKLFATFPETLNVSKDGEVVYRQRYWGNFSQPLDLRNFPMDSQRLTIQVVAVGYNQDEVVFMQNPHDPSGLADELSQTEWEVQAWSVGPVTYEPTHGVEPLSGFELSMDIDRDRYYYVLKVIAPMFLIVAMSWMVFWIKASEPGIRIGIATTSMLTLIAYRFASGSMVPKVSYLTRFDFFILGSTLMVFLVLIMVIITLNMSNSQSSSFIDRVDKRSRILFPAVFVAIIFASFWLG